MMRALLILYCLACTATSAERPNFLVIFTDDQCYRSIGYNNPEVKTPHLDRLAAEGMTLNHAYVASPICTASRASMMSGMFPQQNGAAALDTKNFAPFLKGGEHEQMTLAAQLSNAGYHCEFWGKSHLGDPKKYGFHHGKETRDFDDREPFQKATAFLTEAAKKDEPFFLWLAPRQPHVPLKPKQKWLDLYDETSLSLPDNFREKPLHQSINNQGIAGEMFFRGHTYTDNWRNAPVGPPRSAEVARTFTKAYYATISHLDQQVGDLVAHLDTVGLGKNTIIIFLSDNGFHLGSHGLGNKITMHEESVRVPMWIRWPGTVKAGTTSDALVSSLDVYPTLIDLAKAPMPKHLMGHSLVPLMNDPTTSLREVVFSECTGVGGKLDEGHRMARSKNWKYVLSDTDEEYFYDQVNDVPELKNQIDEDLGKEASELKKLRIAMGQWMERVGDRPYKHQPKD